METASEKLVREYWEHRAALGEDLSLLALNDMEKTNEFLRTFIIEHDTELLEGVAKEVTMLYKCPTTNCDGYGTIANQISDTEWEPQQCQYCYEVRFPLIEAFRSHIPTPKV